METYETNVKQKRSTKSRQPADLKVFNVKQRNSTMCETGQHITHILSI